MSVDPRGAFQQHNELFRSVASPHLSGIGSPSWDPASSRWIPAQRDAISPDGKRYAYAVAGPDYPKTNLHPKLHIVEIATGAEATIGLPGLDPYLAWGVATYKTEGIYLRKLPYEGNTPAGVWLLDPATGSVRAAEELSAIPSGASAYWRAVVDPADPHPVYDSYAGGPLPDEVVRQDIQTGSKVSWFNRPGHIVEFLGVDQGGRPFVLASSGQSSSDSAEPRVVASPGQSELLSSDPATLTISQLVADTHAVWFSGPGGVFTYTSVGGFRKIPGLTGQLAGQCS